MFLASCKHENITTKKLCEELFSDQQQPVSGSFCVCEYWRIEQEGGQALSNRSAGSAYTFTSGTPVILGAWHPFEWMRSAPIMYTGGRYETNKTSMSLIKNFTYRNKYIIYIFGNKKYFSIFLQNISKYILKNCRSRSCSFTPSPSINFSPSPLLPPPPLNGHWMGSLEYSGIIESL